ncbi:MAG: response regulator [Rhodospirillales bacterium]|nr:response regulator [Rhodospirillales bacterium]
MANILVIDDEELVRITLELILKDAGHQVAQALNGIGGLEKQHQTPFDLVITDLIMPEKEGIETIRELHKSYPGLPIIAISGGGRIGNQDLLSMADKLGAVATIAKPFTPEDVLSQVDFALSH